MKRIILILIFLINIIAVKASKIDSLKYVLAEIKNDTLIINTLNKLAEEYIDINMDTSIMFVDSAMAYSKQKENELGILKSYKEYGIVYFYKGNFENARKNFEEALIKAIDLNDNYLIANLYYLIGATNYHNDEYKKALKKYKTALSIAQNRGYKDVESNCYNAIGILYKIQLDYKNAIKYYLKSLKLAEENNDNEAISNLYNNIGVLYKNQELYDDALTYYKKSMKLLLKYDDKNSLINSYNNIGVLYKCKEEYEKANEYFNKAIKVSKDINNEEGLYKTYNNIGNVYKQLKQYDKAIEIFNKALKLIEGSASSSINLYQNMGDLYLILSKENKSKAKMREYLLKAISYSEKAYKISTEIGAESVKKNAAYTLMNAYKKYGDKSKALDYAIIYIELNTKLYNINKLKVINELEKKYNNEKDKILIEKLQKEQELRNEKIKRQQLDNLIVKRQRIVFVIITVLLLFIIIYIAVSLRKNKQLNAKLSTLNNEIESKSKELKLQYLQSVKQNIEIKTKAKEIEDQKEAIIQKHKEIKELDDDYKRIIDSNTDIVFIIDEKGKIIFLNNRTEMLLGFSRDEIIGENFTNFVPETEVEGYIEALNQAFSSEKVKRYENYMKRKDGMHIPVEITGKVIKYKGRNVGAGTIRDITLRKVAEQEIKENTAKYELITNAIDDLIWLVDFNLNFLYVSPSSLKTIGYSDEEVYNILAYHLFTNSSMQILRRKISEARVHKNSRVSAEIEFYNKKGEIVKSDMVGHVVTENGKDIGFVAVSRFCYVKK